LFDSLAIVLLTMRQAVFLVGNLAIITFSPGCRLGSLDSCTQVFKQSFEMGDMLDAALKLPSCFVLGQTMPFDQVLFLAIELPLLQQRFNDVQFIPRIIENDRSCFGYWSSLKSFWVLDMMLQAIHIEEAVEKIHLLHVV
ncbi:hypothetical protein AaE_002619, partial [Aphanomyces astaci]